ncbi:hypothetical protein WA158_003748 [Blastocystis sp. Blastoise]
MSSGYESEGRIDASKDELEGEFSYLRDNDYIQTGYRMALTLKETFLSIFQLHNETVNIWSHFIGVAIFLFLIFYSLTPKYLTAGNKELNKAPLLVYHGQHTPVMFVYYLAEGKSDICVIPSSDEASLYKQYGDVIENMPESLLDSKDSENILANVRPYFNSWITGSYSVETEREFAKDSPNIINSFLNKITEQEKALEKRSSDNTTEIEINNDKNLIDSITELIAYFNSYTTAISRKVSRWPIVVFLCSAIYCCASSAIYHGFYVVDEHASNVLQRMDYLGISVLISGSYVPIIYYAFYCEPFYMKLYLGIVFFLNLANVLVMITPKFRSPEYRPVRSACFVVVASFAWIPLGHLYFIGDYNNPIFTIAFKYIMMMAFTYVLGAFLYAKRIPERWFPGKFDYFFASHNLFHICIVFAAFFHYLGSWETYQNRFNTPCI